MNVYKRKGSKVWWAQFTHRKRRYQFSTGETNRRKADEYATVFKSNINRGEVGLIAKIEGASPTIGELLDRLKTHYELHDKASVQTLSHLARSRKDFGTKRTTSITRETIQDYQKKRQEDGAANATINRVLQYLRRAFTHAKLAPPDFDNLPEHNVRQGFFSEQEIAAVLSHLPNDGLRDFVEWASLTGQRKSEIASLTWSMLDGNQLQIPGTMCKNGKPRVIPLGPDLAAIIERRKKTRHVISFDGSAQLSEPIFHRGDGQRIFEFRKSWKTATRLAECPGRLFHDLRRTVARRLVAAGVHQGTARAFTGHLTDSVFSRYAIVVSADLLAAQAKVSEFRKTISAGGEK